MCWWFGSENNVSKTEFTYKCRFKMMFITEFADIDMAITLNPLKPGDAYVRR